MKTIIYKGRLIHVTMEKPRVEFFEQRNIYTAHLESLWQSSTIHASKELMERFKDGETVVEGKDYVLSDAVFDKTTGRFICIANNAHNLKIDYSQVEFRRIALPVPLPAVEEGSQDEMWDDLLLMVLHDYAKAHGMTDKEAFDFAHFCGKAGKDNLIKYQSQYKLTKI